MRIDFTGQHCVFKQLVIGLGKPRSSNVLDLQEVSIHRQRGNGHAVLGQRSCFIDTKNRGFAQGFNRIETSRQHFLVGNSTCPHGQENDHDDRKFLGQNPHRQRNAGQQGIEPASSQSPVEKCQRQAQADADHRQSARQATHFLAKR